MKKYLLQIYLVITITSVSLSQVSIGDPVINFTLPNLSNQPVSLQQFAGDIILINFFATWCPPCQIEAPQLEDSIWQIYMHQGVTVLGVDLQESAGAVLQFRQQYNLTYPMVLDVSGSVFSSYGFSIIPSNVLVGRDGRIVWIEEGFNIPRFVNLIDSLVQLTDIGLIPRSSANPKTFELIGVYPNPTNSDIRIEFRPNSIGEYELMISDIAGRRILNQTISAGVAGETKKHRISLNDYSSGIYFISLQSADQSQTKKLILVR